MRRHVVTTLGLSLIAAWAAAQSPPTQPSTPPATPGVPGAQAQPLHWAQQLGLRAEQINRVFPLVDRVVLVPDTATYLDEISKWSPLGRWPVLIEDAQYAPMFIRRFSPAQIIRRQSVGALPADHEAKQKLIEAAIIRAWSGDPQKSTIRNVLDAARYVPPGVVITSVDDPAWTAAVALASGHGQPIAFLDGDFSKINFAPLQSDVNKLISRVDSLVAGLGYRHAALGDDIDTITICREIGGRMRVAGPGATDKDSQYFAITDVLGRNADGSRYAFVGWIFGSETRCAYVAMCSLFLPRQRVWLCNTYPTDSQPWANYDIAEPARFLSQIGYDVSQTSGPAVTSRAWLSRLPGGFSTDIAIINTKGNADFFEMFTKGDWCYPNDVPILNVPEAVHFIHSWSMHRPEDVATVGGKWLQRGAYAYVGAVHEPGLQAFVPPAELARRIAAGIPFLVAARLWDSPPWRVNTYGDPLMLCQPPADAPRTRIAQPCDYGVDINELVKQLMFDAKSDESGQAFADAIAMLDLLGRDEIAVGMWRAAQQKHVSMLASRPALGPLFRANNVDAFMQAWNELPQRDDLAMDMLWHLLWPQMTTTTDKDLLLQLQGAIRRPATHVDLGRLVPNLTAVFGQGHARGVVQREIERTDNDGIRKKLEALLK